MKKLIGTMLAHYRIDKVLGQGGMGWVFLGYNTKLDNYVAIKVMNPTFSHDENYIQRFTGEAKRAANLNHPGIVTIHDHGEAEGYLYIVMQYVEGGNLQEKLKKEKTLPLEEVITLIQEICDALHHAHSHEKKIIHRDIKPANIMIQLRDTSVGLLPYRPIIADFGLSKSMDSTLTQTGDSMGTLAYASPEQVQGEPVEASTDIYALGLVCYELIIGQSLFAFTNSSIARRFHYSKEPLPEFDPKLPSGIGLIIRKCLERDPLARYQTARELAEALSIVGDKPRHDDTMVPSPTSPPTPSSGEEDDDEAAGGIIGGIRQKVEGLFASSLADAPVEGRDNLQISSSNKTNYFAIEQDVLTIGSDKRSDLRLRGSNIAPHHARLERAGDGYQVIALHSKYITRIGNAHLQPHKSQKWSEHDLLHIGEHHLWLIPVQKKTQTEVVVKKREDHSNKEPKDVGIGVDKETIMREVDPGNKVADKLKLTNKGAIVDHFTVQVEGLNKTWVQLPDNLPIELNPNKDRSVQISFQPPRVPESRAGDYEFAVLVTSSRDPSARIKIPGMLTVKPFYKFKLDMRPLKQEGGVEGNFDIHLNNQSNTDIPMQMQGRDREDACDYIFDPEHITVHAGAKQVVDLTVRPQGKLVRQGSRSYNFTVTAEVEQLIEQGISESHRQIHGEWVHAPPQFDLRLEPAHQRGVAEGHFAVIIDNKVQFDITVHLSATDPRKQCDYIFEEDKVRIPVGEDRQVQLRVIPNTPLPGTKPREVAFTVTARPASARQLRTDVNGRWEQIPPPFDLTLYPQTYTSKDRGRFMVRVLNQSDVGLSFNVAGRITDKKREYRLDFKQTQIEVAAGDTQTIPLRVRAKDPPPKGEERLYPFVVRAWPDVAPRAIHERGGEWLHTNKLYCWFWFQWVFALTLCLFIASLASYTVCKFGTDYATHLETQATELGIERPVRILISSRFSQMAVMCGFDLIGLSAGLIGIVGLIIGSFVTWRFWEDHEISDGLILSLGFLAMIPVCGAFLYIFDALMGDPIYEENFYIMVDWIFKGVTTFISKLLS